MLHTRNSASTRTNDCSNISQLHMNHHPFVERRKKLASHKGSSRSAQSITFVELSKHLKMEEKKSAWSDSGSGCEGGWFQLLFRGKHEKSATTLSIFAGIIERKLLREILDYFSANAVTSLLSKFIRTGQRALSRTVMSKII